ncbi:hypothetical protein STEG23_014273 [Scotinomys teguina]
MRREESGACHGENKMWEIPYSLTLTLQTLFCSAIGQSASLLNQSHQQIFTVYKRIIPQYSSVHWPPDLSTVDPMIEGPLTPWNSAHRQQYPLRGDKDLIHRSPKGGDLAFRLL